MEFKNVRDKDSGKVFVVNTETGEIVSDVDIKKPKVMPLPHVFTKKSKYVGIDIKYPSQCMIADQYFDSVRQLDGLVNNKVKISTDLIVDAVSDGWMTKNDVKILKFLATRVVAHNRAFTTVKEIEEATNIKSAHVSRWFSENTGVCKVLQNRNGFVLEINPSLVYKGSEEWRSYSLSVWLGEVPIIK